MGIVDRPIRRLLSHPHPPNSRKYLTQSLGWIMKRKKNLLRCFLSWAMNPSRFSPCKTHSREIAQTSAFDPTYQVKTCFDCKMFDVTIWVACLNRGNGPGGTPFMRPFQFHLKEHWSYPQSLDSLLPWTETISAHLDWWQNPTKVMRGSDPHPKTTAPNSLLTPQMKVGVLT